MTTKSYSFIASLNIIDQSRLPKENGEREQRVWPN